jgi:hypothetical protein
VDSRICAGDSNRRISLSTLILNNKICSLYTEKLRQRKHARSVTLSHEWIHELPPTHVPSRGDDANFMCHGYYRCGVSISGTTVTVNAVTSDKPKVLPNASCIRKAEGNKRVISDMLAKSY